MTFQFKIQIKGITKPPVWRRILVPDTFTFEDFHYAIQNAFGWWDSHLFLFSPKGWGSQPVLSIPDENGWDEPDEDAREITLKRVFQKEGDNYIYIYDFGDDWIHQITLEKITKETVDGAKCIAGKGACPPEDCGGARGYESLKEILADPKHPEYEEMKEWVGLNKNEEWDPAYFSLEETQEEIESRFEDAEENSTPIIPIFSQKPQFNHPEVELLYHVSCDIDRTKLHEIMALPRKTLIEDMETILKDSILRQPHFLQFEEDESRTSFPLHALYILSALQAEEASGTILYFVNQWKKVYEYDVIDTSIDDFWEFLYWICQNRLNLLKEIILNADNDEFLRIAALEAALQIALHQPDRKQEIIQWQTEVLESFLENINNRKIFHPILFESLLLDLISIGDSSILPLVKRCLDSGKISRKEANLNSIKRELERKRPSELDIEPLHTDIDQFYDYWGEWMDYENDFFDYDEEEDDSFFPLFNNPFTTQPKIGRNDACPCGSGKKYKKCCGKEE